jgi:hypothetical protein
MVGQRSFSSGSGCRICWVPRNNLFDVSATWGIKTKQSICSLLQEYLPQKDTPKIKTAIDKASALLGFPLSPKSPFFNLSGDPCLLSPPDILHNERLGMIMREIFHIIDLLSAAEKEKFINQLRLCTPPKHGSSLSASAFDPNTTLTGKEWGTIMWSAPFALLNIMNPASPLLLLPTPL